MLRLGSSALKILLVLFIGFCLCACLAAGSLLMFRQARTLALVGASSLSATATPGAQAAHSAAAPVALSASWMIDSGSSPATDPAAAPTAVPERVSFALAVSPAETPGAEQASPATVAPPPTPVAPAVSPRLAAPSARQTFNVILLGTDRNETGKGTWRTDVTVLTVLDPESRTAGVLALPRDLWVNIPGHDPNRINTVDYLGHYTKYPGDGPALLNRTLQEDFGFGFDRYIRVDFNGFSQIVDELGGIDVDVDCPLEEVFADPAYPGGRLLKVSAGLQHMDGGTALLYIRQRHNNGDTDRSRREFKVLMALREKALKLNTIPLLPKLWTTYRANVQTDLSLPEIVQLIGWLVDFKPDSVHGRIVDETLADQWTTPQGWWVLLPHTDQIRAAYDDLMSAPKIIDAGHRTRCPQ